MDSCEASNSSKGRWSVEVKRHSDDCCAYSVKRDRLTLHSLCSSRLVQVLLTLSLSYTIWMVDIAFIQETAIPQIILMLVLCILAFVGCVRLCQAYHVCNECVLVVRTYGVQVTTEYSNGKQQHQFISAEQIHSIVINEGISMHQIFYYLTIVLKENGHLTKLYPLFMSSRPRFAVLQFLYTAINNDYVYPLPT